jgi:hypothetical protein
MNTRLCVALCLCYLSVLVHSVILDTAKLYRTSGWQAVGNPTTYYEKTGGVTNPFTLRIFVTAIPPQVTGITVDFTDDHNAPQSVQLVQNGVTFVVPAGVFVPGYALSNLKELGLVAKKKGNLVQRLIGKGVATGYNAYHDTRAHMASPVNELNAINFDLSDIPQQQPQQPQQPQQQPQQPQQWQSAAHPQTTRRSFFGARA